MDISSLLANEPESSFKIDCDDLAGTLEAANAIVDSIDNQLAEDALSLLGTTYAYYCTARFGEATNLLWNLIRKLYIYVQAIEVHHIASEIPNHTGTVREALHQALHSVAGRIRVAPGDVERSLFEQPHDGNFHDGPTLPVDSAGSGGYI